MKLLMRSRHPLVISSLLGSNILIYLFLKQKTLNEDFALNVRNEVNIAHLKQQ